MFHPQIKSSDAEVEQDDVVPCSAEIALSNQTQEQKQKRVLIVEDYEDNRFMMKLMLRRLNLMVLEAANGKEAIEVACSQHPDLILMDISMPVMDGFEATCFLKSCDETSDIPIIALSAHCSDAQAHDKALRLGCLDCMDKPVQSEQIKTIMHLLA